MSTPTPTPLPAGPFAVVYTNKNTQGSTYDVLLLSTSGVVVARTTAKLPTVKPHQTLNITPVFAGTTHAYFVDGDVEIHSLGADGTTQMVKSISGGATAEFGFAVSPDESRIAVGLVTEADDPTKSVGQGYVEDLADSRNHLPLYNNTSSDAYRYPLAWFGDTIVDAIAPNGCGNGYGYVQGAFACIQSLHSISDHDGSRIAALCEAPQTQPSGTTVTDYLEGAPVAAGITCSSSSYSSASQSQTCSQLALGWNGSSTSFASCGAEGYVDVANCFLSPDGSQMACTAVSNGVMTMLKPGDHEHSLGRKYTLLGWMDATHFLVDIDADNLAVVDVTSGNATNVPLPGADKVGFAGVLGGQG